MHIFPISFKNQRSADYLAKYVKDFPEYKGLADRLKQVYYYFEKRKSLPVIMTNEKGEYVFGDEVKLTGDDDAHQSDKKQVHRKDATPVPFDETELVNSVNKLPVYPGGSEAFQQFLDDLSKKLTAFLPADQKKTFITVEYIVNKSGKVILPKVLKGANNEMNNLIIEKFEAMPLWTPAVRLEKNVPIRLKQTIYVEMP